MKVFFINKWIQEINLEIGIAQNNQNYAKVLDLRWLRHQLLLLMDKLN